MNMNAIINELVAERDRLNKAIEVLTDNPYIPKPAPVAALGTWSSHRQRKLRSAESRAAQSEKMRAYWARRHKAQRAKR